MADHHHRHGLRARRKALTTFPRSVLSIGVLVAAVLVSGPILGRSSAPAAVAPAAATPPSPESVEAVPYSGGRAFVTWAAGTGNESDSYQVETFEVASNGLRSLGKTAAYGDDTVVGGLQPGTSYLFSVSAINASGIGPSSNSGIIEGAGPVSPEAPTGVTLTATGADNQLLLSWTPSTRPVSAEVYKIGVVEGTGTAAKQVGAVSCDNPCTSIVLQARPGSTTTAFVNATNSVGYDGAWSNSVVVPQPCRLACVTVAAADPASTVGHQSNGFLDASGPADPSGLAPTQWRTDDWTLEQVPAAVINQLHGASITDILSDDWRDSHNIAGYAITPWSDWSAYSEWITADVKAVEAQGAERGFKISYWEIQNEPFGGHYYSPSSKPPASETVANFEQQFLVAYEAIKAADPGASVIGPSLIAWDAEPGDTPSIGIDMHTFLDFCAAHGIRLGAVAFHDNNFFPLDGWYAPDGSPAQPAEIGSFVSQLRSMIAARPSLGNPAILINEYGDPSTYELPGWSVGWIAALDQAGVSGAGRSCWDGCGNSLDGLLANGGTAPRPTFWVYSFYASMTGRTVPVTSTYTGVTGVASVAPNGTILALLGRHENCTRTVNWRCPSLPAEPVTVEIQVPGTNTATVKMAEIPMGSTTSSPLYQLSPSEMTVPVIDGLATITTPALHDGDALELSVAPV